MLVPTFLLGPLSLCMGSGACCPSEGTCTFWRWTPSPSHQNAGSTRAGLPLLTTVSPVSTGVLQVVLKSHGCMGGGVGTACPPHVAPNGRKLTLTSPFLAFGDGSNPEMTVDLNPLPPAQSIRPGDICRRVQLRVLSTWPFSAAASPGPLTWQLSSSWQDAGAGHDFHRPP